MSKAPTALVNGAAVEQISIRDRGFLYGDGLFETVAVAQGVPLLWERHMNRLYRDAARLSIVPPAEILLRQEAERICHGAEHAVLKIAITRGNSERGYASTVNAPTRVLSLTPWPDYPPSHAQHGVVVCFCRTILARSPVLAGIKHLNRLEQVLARAEWGSEYQEGLMQDENGQVVEGTMSNVFAVSGGTLLTPVLSHAGVEGVMRGLVLERAAALSLSARTLALTPDDILQADEVFLTNSLIGLWPVRRIESREYPVGKVTQQIRQALRDARAFN